MRGRIRLRDIYLNQWEVWEFKYKNNAIYVFLSSSDFLSVVFLFVFFFCYNVIHLRWMTVVAHPIFLHPVSLTSSAPLPDTTIHLLTYYIDSNRRRPPPPVVLPVLHSDPRTLARPLSGIPPDPLPFAFLALSSVRRTPHVLIAPIAPIAPMGSANNNIIHRPYFCLRGSSGSGRGWGGA